MKSWMNYISAKSWAQMFWLHLGWVAVLAASLTVIFTGISAALFANVQFIDQNSEKLQLEFVSYRSETGQPRDWFAVFRGEGQGGLIEDELKVDFLFHYSHEIGSTVSLFAVWDDPPYLLMALPNYAPVGSAFEIAALFVGAFALGFGGYAAIQSTDAVRARRYGPSEKGKVTGKKDIYRWRWERLLFDRNLFSDSRWIVPTGKARLLFTDPFGRNCVSLQHSEVSLRDYSLGDEIDIYGGIGTSWWVRDVGQRTDLESDLPKVRAR